MSECTKCPTLIEQYERMREAIAGATSISSGPDGSGTMRVVVAGFKPGEELALFGVLHDALNQQEETNGYRS